MNASLIKFATVAGRTLLALIFITSGFSKLTGMRLRSVCSRNAPPKATTTSNFDTR